MAIKPQGITEEQAGQVPDHVWEAVAETFTLEELGSFNSPVSQAVHRAVWAVVVEGLTSEKLGTPSGPVEQAIYRAVWAAVHAMKGGA